MEQLGPVGETGSLPTLAAWRDERVGMVGERQSASNSFLSTEGMLDLSVMGIVIGIYICLRSFQSLEPWVKSASWTNQKLRIGEVLLS